VTLHVGERLAQAAQQLAIVERLHWPIAEVVQQLERSRALLGLCGDDAEDHRAARLVLDVHDDRLAQLAAGAAEDGVPDLSLAVGRGEEVGLGQPRLAEVVGVGRDDAEALQPGPLVGG
jgi:hypothetical protein